MIQSTKYKTNNIFIQIIWNITSLNTPEIHFNFNLNSKILSLHSKTVNINFSSFYLRKKKDLKSNMRTCGT